MAHYYSTDAKPQHQIINLAQTKRQKKNIFRDSTIDDARKNNWYPGFTAIGGQFAKPGLEAWKKNEMWKVLDREDNLGDIEPFSHYRQRIEKVLKEELEQYQKLGSKVHAAIEGKGRRGDPATDEDRIINACLECYRDWRDEFVYDIIAPEQAFCSPEWGYGGCVDLQYTDKDGRYCIVDFKTKWTTAGVEIVQGLEQKRQLVAYALGLGKILAMTDDHGMITGTSGWNGENYCGLPILGKLYLSTTEPGRWEYHEVPQKEISELILDVRDCVRLWNRENNFGPFAATKTETGD